MTAIQLKFFTLKNVFERTEFSPVASFPKLAEELGGAGQRKGAGGSEWVSRGWQEALTLSPCVLPQGTHWQGAGIGQESQNRVSVKLGKFRAHVLVRVCKPSAKLKPGTRSPL